MIALLLVQLLMPVRLGAGFKADLQCACEMGQPWVTVANYPDTHRDEVVSVEYSPPPACHALRTRIAHAHETPQLLVCVMPVS